MISHIQKNKRVIISLLIFIAIITFNKVFGQNNYITGKDTTTIGNYSLIIELPFQSIKKVTQYEEGVFITYYSKDSALITIHYGAMVSKPLFLGSTQQKCTINNKFVFENELYSYDGFCLPIDTIYKNRKYYFREIDFIKKKITLMYEFVNEGKVKIYDNVLDNIVITQTIKD